MALREQRIDRSFVPGIADPAQVTAARRSASGWIGRIVFGAVLVAFSIIFIFPLVWLVAASLKPGSEVFNSSLIGSQIQVSNYSRLLSLAPQFGSWFLNSVIVSGLAATTVTLSSALVAFGFAYFRFPYRNAVFGLVLATMMLPGAVTMIPTFLIWKSLGFYNTLVPLWAGNLFASAIYIFLLRQFFLGLPRDMFEAARVDGASYWRLFWRIALPLCKPALVVTFIFEFRASWTDLIKPLIYLRRSELYTLPRGLKAVLDQFG